MVKKIIVVLSVTLGVYISVAAITSTLALAQFRSIKAQAQCDKIDDTLQRVRVVKNEIFLIRPLLKLSNNYNEQLKLLDFASESPVLIKELLGINNEKNLLLVLQNNAELRASGGIWGAYGVMKIKDCQIISFQTNDTYYLDEQNKGKFTPPEGTESIIGDEWRFWNANWSPDFKKSVEQGLFFYKQVDPKISFDGVLGPNVDYLLSLIKISGPIKLANHDFELNSDNFVEKMIYEPATPAIIETTKDQQSVVSPTEKNFVIADIGKSIIDQIIKNGRTFDLLDPTIQALDNKDFILYFSNPQLQNDIEKVGWAGRLNPIGNFISVVDANFGSKLDFQIDKRIRITKISATQYRVDLDYSNNVNPNAKDQPFLTYRDLVRIFLPNGSKQIEQQGGQLSSDMKIDTQTNLSYMSSMLIMKPTERQTVSFIYEVPNNLSNQKVQIIQQSGQHAQIINDLHN